MLFEYRAEIAAVVITDSGSYLIDVAVILHKHKLSLLDTLPCKILKRSEIVTLFEQPAKILRRQIDKICQLIEGQLVAEVLIDIVDNRLDLIELLTVLAAVS